MPLSVSALYTIDFQNIRNIMEAKRNGNKRGDYPMDEEKYAGRKAFFASGDYGNSNNGVLDME